MAYNRDDNLSRFQVICFEGGREGGREVSEFYVLQECKWFGCRKMNFKGPIVNQCNATAICRVAITPGCWNMRLTCST